MHAQPVLQVMQTAPRAAVSCEEKKRAFEKSHRRSVPLCAFPLLYLRTDVSHQWTAEGSGRKRTQLGIFLQLRRWPRTTTPFLPISRTCFQRPTDGLRPAIKSDHGLSHSVRFTTYSYARPFYSRYSGLQIFQNNGASSRIHNNDAR